MGTIQKTELTPTARRRKRARRIMRYQYSYPSTSEVTRGPVANGDGPVRWHPPCQSGGEGARGPIIAESEGCPWLRPGSRGRDAPRLEDSRLSPNTFSARGQKGQSAVKFSFRRALALPSCVSRFARESRGVQSDRDADGRCGGSWLEENRFKRRTVLSARMHMKRRDNGRVQWLHKIGTFVIYPVDPGFCRIVNIRSSSLQVSYG
ncbi:hypothetical protein ANTRET_LOCUS8783 [Anthophora retusa]